MTNPRRLWWAVFGPSAVVLCGLAFAAEPVTRGPMAPHDYGVEFRDDPEPAPEPTPEPSDELTVELILPEKLPAGEFIPFKLRHNGSLANIAYLVDWKPAGGHLLTSEEGGHVTHVPGPHTLTVYGAIDGTAVMHSTPFVIEGAVPGPGPGPGPIPQQTLRDLLPSDEHREKWATFFGDLAIVAKTGAYSTTAGFRNGYRQAIATAQAAGNLPKGAAAIDKPVSDRIAAAIGLADTTLDAAKQAALVACLESISAEIGGK